MNDEKLIGGIVTYANCNDGRCQDTVEIKLVNGRTVILTATPSGRIKVGEKMDEAL